MSEKEKTSTENLVEVTDNRHKKSGKVWRVVAITTIVILVGLLIFGLVVWNNYRKQIDELQNKLTAQQNQTENLQTDSSTGQSETVTPPVVVKIPEAGIQFAVPSGYPTISYKNNGDSTYAIIAADTINPGSMCQAQDGSVGVLVGNTRERLISLGDDPDSGEFGTQVNGKYWTVATGGVCDNNNSSNKVNQLLEYIKSHISGI